MCLKSPGTPLKASSAHICPRTFETHFMNDEIGNSVQVSCWLFWLFLVPLIGFFISYIVYNCLFDCLFWIKCKLLHICRTCAEPMVFNRDAQSSDRSHVSVTSACCIAAWVDLHKNCNVHTAFATQDMAIHFGKELKKTCTAMLPCRVIHLLWDLG